MKYYQHRFSDVESYLHHRSPYLLVDRIEKIEDNYVITRKVLDSEMPVFQGHFPGAPIFPGAMMQEFLTQSAGVLIAANYNPMESYDTTDPNHNYYALGVLVKVESARYRQFARPGDTLVGEVHLKDIAGSLFSFSGTLRVDDQVVMRIKFTLANIESSELTRAK